ncbi:hypothetical protein RN001_006792 [Aquatica leii]|uniref:CWH43-like N-terminal domain-containing protein n=1 Tax=Aquatica leii TaxID=1421715 RepID=A0AAN7QLB4_9COLE|nr:hypothetical protein RN001_006792 [Aquatica leii]
MQIVRYFPIIICGYQVLACIITYSIAVYNKHVYYLFPYISDTGALTPEMNVFGQLFNIGAMLMAFGLFVRYKQVENDINTKNITLKPIWNKIVILLGFIASFGVSVVANFSEYSILSIHLFGAFLAFGIGSFYFYIQTWISSYYLKARNRRISRLTFCTRLVLACILVPLHFTGGHYGYLSFKEFHGESYLLWSEEDGGYNYHLLSVFSEWFMYLDMFFYILTFSREYQKIEVGLTFKFK